MRDTDRAELVLAADALQGSLFRMLRQGQRVNFEVDANGRATHIRIGSEPDMGLPTAQV
jgi:CspA family cold shock protein